MSTPINPVWLSNNNPFNRRSFLGLCAAAGAGLMMPEAVVGSLDKASEAISGVQFSRKVTKIPNAKQWPTIFIFLEGGPSQWEFFHPKLPNPGSKDYAPSEIRGEFKPIQTSVPGLFVSEKLEKTSQIMHKVRLLRNITHTDFDHDRACAWCLTGSPELIPGTTTPQYGSFLVDLSKQQLQIPGYIVFHSNNFKITSSAQAKDSLYTAYDETKGTYPNPIQGENTDLSNLEGRVALSKYLGKPIQGTERYEELFDKASGLIDSDLGKAFNLDQISNAERERYGKNVFGEAAIRAKRLVEKGAQFVFINFAFWDAHSVINWYTNTYVPKFDPAYAALVEDLGNQCIIVVASEFGRRPDIDPKTKGRHHFPVSNCMVISGPGVTPGCTGETDSNGRITNGGKFHASRIASTTMRAAGYKLELNTGNGILEEVEPLPIF